MADPEHASTHEPAHGPVLTMPDRAWPDVNGEGRLDAFDPMDLDDIRRRVVDPVFMALIHPRDLDRLDVRIGRGPQDPDLGHVAVPGEGDVWVRVRLDEAVWDHVLGSHSATGERPTLGEVVWWLASEMSDWTCESVYWAEQPTSRILIPGRE
jgi:hypothetical protein